MGVCQPKRDNVDDDGTVMVDVSDESTSLSINFERLKVDLNDDMVAPAFFIDSVDRISRYLLFKLADYIVNAYPPWHKYVFEETDIKSRKLLVRHDVAGQGHPVAKNGPGEDDFELNRGLPVTMDDEVVRRHYQDKRIAGNSNHDGDEMMRRYRFSVVITKLIEALYRRGYDLDGSFRTRVRESTRSVKGITRKW